MVESRLKRLRLGRRHSHHRAPGHLSPPRNRTVDLHALSNSFRSHKVAGPRLLDFLEMRLGRLRRPRTAGSCDVTQQRRSDWRPRTTDVASLGPFARHSAGQPYSVRLGYTAWRGRRLIVICSRDLEKYAWLMTAVALLLHGRTGDRSVRAKHAAVARLRL